MKAAAIAFYNTENFFDIGNDPEKFDNEFTPDGTLRWTRKRYNNKLRKISWVISQIGIEETSEPPLFVGLAEIENRTVLKDLVESENLAKYNYEIVHFDSLDERGIDNALIYRKDLIDYISAEPIRQTYERPDGRIDYSRDALHVKFKINRKKLHVFVTHFPSRANNDDKREFRNQIMSNLRLRIDEILNSNPLAQVAVIGDMNGNPNDFEARALLRTTDELNFDNNELYNPMLKFDKNTGSLTHDRNWILFDQMLFSKSFFGLGEDLIRFQSAHIFQPNSVMDWDKKFFGTPFRTYAGTKYLGGYSDHFPVYAILNY